MTIRCVLDDALQRADLESARRCPSSADEGRKPTSSRESRTLGGDGRVCSRPSCSPRVVPRHGRRAPRCDAALCRTSPEDEVVREPACSSSCGVHRVHTDPSRAITTSSRWLRGRCRAPRAPTCHALRRTGANGGWCRETPTIDRRLRLRARRVNLDPRNLLEGVIVAGWEPAPVHAVSEFIKAWGPNSTSRASSTVITEHGTRSSCAGYWAEK